MAAGGVFLIPGPKNTGILVCSIAACVLISLFFQSLTNISAVPVYTLSFNVVTILLLYTMGIVRYRRLTQVIKPTPEETLDKGSGSCRDSACPSATR